MTPPTKNQDEPKSIPTVHIFSPFVAVSSVNLGCPARCVFRGALGHQSWTFIAVDTYRWWRLATVTVDVRCVKGNIMT